VVEMLAVLSTVVLPEAIVPVPVTVELWVRVLSVAGGFSTVLFQTGSVPVVVTVVTSVLGVRVE
jgi:hypothetical protein